MSLLQEAQAMEQEIIGWRRYFHENPELGLELPKTAAKVQEELKKMGMNIINDDITGRVHKDRKVLTGDSPFAANALGKLAAQEMLAAYAG